MNSLPFNPKTLKTLEFLLLVVSNVAAWVLYLVDYFPSEYAVYFTAISGALYALARGLAKVNSSTADYWMTTEFWVAVLASIPTTIAAFQDVIDPRQYGILQGVIVMLSGIANGIRKNPDVAAGNLDSGMVAGDFDTYPGDDVDDQSAAEAEVAEAEVAVATKPKK